MLQLLLVQSMYGQEFHLQSSLDLPDTVTFHAVEWADVDNDGSLDVLAFGSNRNDETICFFWKNSGFETLEYAGYFNTELQDGAWLITDIDGDNSVDIVVSGLSDKGALTSRFLNRGDFAFEQATLFSLHGTVMVMADFNQDGRREMLISGNDNGSPFLNILEHQDGGWKLVHDSIAVHASSVELFDFDADGDIDFHLTGTDESGAEVSSAFYNRHAFYFTAQSLVPTVSGVSMKGDLNHDGSFDILLAGDDESGRPRLVALLNDGLGNFSVVDTLRPAKHARVFIGDLNSDGLSDINIHGLDDNGDTINVIASEQENLLPHKSLITQSWGDGDRDGDLDLLQLVRTPAGSGLNLFQNANLPHNAAPERPSGLVIAGIFNRLFVCWEKPTDDRTPLNSLTYDVAIHSEERNVMSADFDLLTGRRLNVSHGNNGTADYVLLKGVGSGDVGVNIQSVDNSFHAGPGSICKGSGGGGNYLCSEVEAVNLDLCKSETVTLPASPGTLWFSFEHGFLADTSALVFDFHQPDTIFSLTRNPDCARIAVYVLDFAENVTRVTESSEYVCEGDVLQLSVEPDWESVEWSSLLNGFLSNEDSITYVVTEMDTVKVIVSDANGCAIQRNTAINISKPVITGDDAYQILKGESVRLSVSGGTRYEWLPSTALDDPASADPLASPLKTTEYVVTASDTSGCRSSMRILVLVEETAFVPNLFTPNHDGKNDVLKIYGLGQVNGFSFTVYNREGSKVYHTQDVGDALTQGWNGTAGGVDQPGGVYYWNVTGQTASGKELQLNGRKSGSIVLVR